MVFPTSNYLIVSYVRLIALAAAVADAASMVGHELRCCLNWRCRDACADADSDVDRSSFFFLALCERWRPGRSPPGGAVVWLSSYAVVPATRSVAMLSPSQRIQLWSYCHVEYKVGTQWAAPELGGRGQQPLCPYPYPPSVASQAKCWFC